MRKRFISSRIHRTESNGRIVGDHHAVQIIRPVSVADPVQFGRKRDVVREGCRHGHGLVGRSRLVRRDRGNDRSLGIDVRKRDLRGSGIARGIRGLEIIRSVGGDFKRSGIFRPDLVVQAVGDDRFLIRCGGERGGLERSLGIAGQRNRRRSLVEDFQSFGIQHDRGDRLDMVFMSGVLVRPVPCHSPVRGGRVVEDDFAGGFVVAVAKHHVPQVAGRSERDQDAAACIDFRRVVREENVPSAAVSAFTVLVRSPSSL